MIGRAELLDHPRSQQVHEHEKNRAGRHHQQRQVALGKTEAGGCLRLGCLRRKQGRCEYRRNGGGREMNWWLQVFRPGTLGAVERGEHRIGKAIIERMPSMRQLSRSTRESVSASSQRCRKPVRAQYPEKPEVTSSVACTGGASPELARHTMARPSARAMAAPLARVKVRARSAINCSAASRLDPFASTSRCTADKAASVVV